MVPTNRYMNWSGVTMASTPITGVKEISYDEGISVKEESGDADQGPTVAVVDWRNPFFNMTLIDAGVLLSMISGVKGIFQAVLRDAYNGNTVSGGAKQFLTNSLGYIAGRQINGTHREYGRQTLMIKTASLDGTTNPVTITSV